MSSDVERPAVDKPSSIDLGIEEAHEPQASSTFNTITIRILRYCALYNGETTDFAALSITALSLIQTEIELYSRI